MHINTGKYKGLRIDTESKYIRPTMAKARAAFFSSLGERIVDAEFLDLFCGSGAMAIEAISRGAKRAVGVDLHLEVAQKNKARLDVKELTLYRNDALKALETFNKKKEMFDILFIDPPYDYRGKSDLLFSLAKFDILKRDGLLCLESDTKAQEPDALGSLRKIRIYEYGQTQFTLYACAD